MNQQLENRGDVLLQKWLDGTITWQEERELEQLAQGDAMLAEALEGFRAMPEGNHLQKMDQLKVRLQERTSNKRRGLVFYLPRVAAAAAIVATLAVGIWYLNENGSQRSGVGGQRSEVENDVPAIADVLEESDTNAVLALEEEVTRAESASSRQAARSKLRVQDGVQSSVTNAASDTIAEIAASEQAVADEAKPTEAAPPAPRTFERAQSTAAARALSAGRVITGKVTDASGEPITGASVVVPGTNQGTVSDVEGNFKIEVPPGKEQLALNYTGFETKEINIAKADSVNVKLEESAQALEEVVVSGYGKAKQNNPTRTENREAKKAEALPGKAQGAPTTQQPVPRGGFEKLKQHIDKNLRYPQAAREASIEGEVVVAFTILPNGQLTDFKMVKSLGYGLDEEAIRLLKAGPRWNMRSKTLQKDTASYMIEFKLK